MPRLIDSSIVRDLKERYPIHIRSGGRDLVVRPLRSNDEGALGGFFRRIPLEERGMFRDNVSDPSVISSWCRNLDYQRVLPLIASDGDRIVADATLHKNPTRVKAHVGGVRIVVDPEYRRRDLARALLSELIDLAPALGLDWLDAEIGANQPRSLNLLKKLSFTEVGRLPDHLKDHTGVRHDLVFLVRPVRATIEEDEGGEG